MIKLNVDCLGLIFNELQTDKNDLYSCLLVNKEWCRLVVPILWKIHSWKSPLYMYYGKEKLINTILSWLPSSSKQLLSDNDIKLPSTTLLKPPLFNYINFCEFPNVGITGVIDRIMEMVFEKFDAGKHYDHDNRNLFEQELYKFFVSQCKGTRDLRWETSQPLSLFSGASTCFSQLHNLHIDFNFVNPYDLYEMAQICRDLNKLTISNFSQNLPGLISLIDSQRNLKSVVLSPNFKNGTCEELSKALARKGDTIDYLELCSVNAIQFSFLTSFIGLKKLVYHNNKNYEKFSEVAKEFQQCLATSEFPDLQDFYISNLLCFKELAMLIEKTKGNISSVWISHTNEFAKDTGMLIESITNNCPKIKSLETFLVPNDFILVKSLLINCRNLNYIGFQSLNFLMNENNNTGDELLNILTEFSPKSLTEIAISGDWKYSTDAFERFFESYRKKTLTYFQVTHSNKGYITENHN